jgi:hypothetical protein
VRVLDLIARGGPTHRAKLARRAKLLASVCNLLNPRMIIAGGTTAQAGSIVLDPIRRA